MTTSRPFPRLHLRAAFLPLITCLAVVGCGDDTSTSTTSTVPTQSAQISGQVLHRVTHQPLANVTVSFAGKTIQTDANGRFSLTNLTAGVEGSLSASLAQYDPSGVIKLTLTSGQNLQNLVLELSPTPQTEMALRIFDARTGAVVSGARVSVGALSAVSNTTGDSVLAHVAPNARVLVNVTAAGYANQVLVVNLGTDEKITGLNVQLVPLNMAGTVNALTGGTVSVLNSAAQVVVPANSLRRVDGQPIVGAVKVEIALIDPTQDIDQMPGQMIAINATGVTSLIESFGAMTIQMTDSTGAVVTLQNGQRANVRIPAVSRGTLLASVPLYYFDVIAGYWKTDGTLTLNTTTSSAPFYEGSTSTLGTVNADTPYVPVSIKGCLEDQAGLRINHASVLLEGISYSGSSQVQTNSNGEFTAYARPNASVFVTGQTGRQISNSKEMVTLNNDIDDTSSCLILTDTATNVRVELTWGALPEDVDAHMITPSGDIIYYSNKGGLAIAPYLNLDVDDTTSFGPEIMTTSRLMVGTYQYIVNNYDFSFNPALTGSPVRVELNSVNGTQVFTPNAGEVSDETRAWHVFNLTVDAQCHLTVSPIRRWLTTNQFDVAEAVPLTTPVYCIPPIH